MTKNRFIGIGMLYMLSGAFFFSLMNSCLKVLSNSITTNENMFFRSITMSMFIILIMIIKRKKTKKQRGGYLRLLTRVSMGTISLYTMLYNISTIPLGTSIAFSQSMPIYTAILSWIFFKARLNKSAILSIIIGFCGVILISNPSAYNIHTINVIYGILSAMCAAFAFISIRSLKGYFSDLEIILSFGVFASITSLIIIMITQDNFSPIGIKDFIFIILTGITGTIGQYYITKAYMIAPPNIISPIDYTRILFSLILGIILGDVIPDMYSIFGIFLIIISGVLIALSAITPKAK